MQIEAFLNEDNHTISIKQRIHYQNTSKEDLSELYFNDWTSSLSSPTTPLANRFVEEFNGDLLAVKDKDRGYTKIRSIQKNF